MSNHFDFLLSLVNRLYGAGISTVKFFSKFGLSFLFEEVPLIFILSSLMSIGDYWVVLRGKLSATLLILFQFTAIIDSSRPLLILLMLLVRAWCIEISISSLLFYCLDSIYWSKLSSLSESSSWNLTLACFQSLS